MKRAEVAAMFNYLGRFYPAMSEKALNKEVVEAWQELIHFVKKEDCWVILKDYIKENKFEPSVSDIVIPWRLRGFEKSTDRVGD